MKKILFLIGGLALAAAGYYWATTYYLDSNAASSPIEDRIVASGVIEVETILITSESGGRIAEVLAEEGAEVAAGDVLVRLDDSQVRAQEAELEAAIRTAQENLAAAEATPRPVDIAMATAELAQAQASRDGAYQVWQDLLRVVQEPQELLLPIRDLQAQVKQAELALEAREVEHRSATIREEAAARDQSGPGKIAYQIAQKQSQAADLGVQLARATLQALQTQVAHLWEQYENPISLQTQADQAESNYVVAEAAVRLAEAQLAAAKMAPRKADVAVAEAQLEVAKSARTLLAAQRATLTLVAPRAGLISSRVVEPGELAVPGATLLILADLRQVTLRVYIPETLVGRVQLGQPVQVTTDSIDRTLPGLVTAIATEAEFTPRNVQMAQERVNLVFAVEISLDNPDHILKPGMPADAEIIWQN